VHPPIQSEEVGQVAEPTGLSEDEGIEQPNFDIPMRTQHRQRVIEPGDTIVIEQKSHPDTAIRGVVQRAESRFPETSFSQM
jgi:hypothetical protein